MGQASCVRRGELSVSLHFLFLGCVCFMVGFGILILFWSQIRHVLTRSCECWRVFGGLCSILAFGRALVRFGSILERFSAFYYLGAFFGVVW